MYPEGIFWKGLYAPVIKEISEVYEGFRLQLLEYMDFFVAIDRPVNVNVPLWILYVFDPFRI